MRYFMLIFSLMDLMGEKILIWYILHNFGFSLVQTELIPLTLPPEVIDRIEKDEVLKNPNLTTFEINCVENGGIKAYGAAKNATSHLTECLKNDSNLLHQDIVKARSNGNTKEVLKKYCQGKRDMSCVHEMLYTLEACSSIEEKHNFVQLHKVVDVYQDVICKDDGDIISVFYAEDGPECWSQYRSRLNKCTYDIVGINLNLDTDNLLGNMSKLTFDVNHCYQMLNLMTCVRDELKQCQGKTIPSIFGTVFEQVLNQTECNTYHDIVTKLKEANSAWSLQVTMLTIVTAAFSLLLYII